VRAKAAKPDLEAVAAGKMEGPALWAKVALAALDGDVRKAGDVVRAGLAGRTVALRTAAADALQMVGADERDVPALVRLSREPSAAAKAAAARALGLIGARAKDAVPRLVELLGDRDAEVRIAAAAALGRVGLPAAAPAVARLREAIRSDPSLAPTARKVLEKLGVKDDLPRE
jgi:HEAT repeat protein